MAVSTEDSYTFACVDVPYLQIVKTMTSPWRNETDSTSGVVTTADDLVPTYVKTSYARGVAVEDTEHDSLLDVPYTESRVSRPCHCDRAVVQYSGTSDSGGMPAKDVDTMSKRP